MSHQLEPAARDQPGVGSAAPRTPYFPLPWGDLDAACADCDADPGGWHQRGCPGELCSTCGGRLAECGCARVDEGHRLARR